MIVNEIANTVDEINELLGDGYSTIGLSKKGMEEVITLRTTLAKREKQLKVATHLKDDDAVGFDWKVLSRIAELENLLKEAQKYNETSCGEGSGAWVINGEFETKIAEALKASE